MSDCDRCSQSSCAGCPSASEKKVNPQDVAIHQFLGQVKHKFIVMSGKGGVGKSTVSVDLALLLAEKVLKWVFLMWTFTGPALPVCLAFPMPI